MSERFFSVFGGILLCFAISLFTYLAGNIIELSQAVADAYKDNSSLITEWKNGISEEPIVTYEQIICELMEDKKEYDLIICGNYIGREEYNSSMLLDYIPLKCSNYKKNVYTDNLGIVYLVEYTVGE